MKFIDYIEIVYTKTSSQSPVDPKLGEVKNDQAEKKEFKLARKGKRSKKDMMKDKPVQRENCVTTIEPERSTSTTPDTTLQSPLVKSRNILLNAAIVRFFRQYNLPLTAVEDPAFLALFHAVSQTNESFLPLTYSIGHD
jgi:hypothetical protein